MKEKQREKLEKEETRRVVLSIILVYVSAFFMCIALLKEMEILSYLFIVLIIFSFAVMTVVLFRTLDTEEWF